MAAYPPFDPEAPYGRDPRGQPWSKKYRSIAGLLQIFGGVVLPGVGRLYMGSTTVAAVYIGLWVLGVLTVLTFIGIPMLVGVHVWAFVDGVLILFSQHPYYSCDGQGRPLR
jgi:TM2 domain-containing membrane protein YozV